MYRCSTTLPGRSRKSREFPRRENDSRPPRRRLFSLVYLANASFPRAIVESRFIPINALPTYRERDDTDTGKREKRERDVREN